MRKNKNNKKSLPRDLHISKLSFLFMLSCVLLLLSLSASVNSFAGSNITTPITPASSSTEISKISDHGSSERICQEYDNRKPLRSGWSSWIPYQFEKNSISGPVISGMDIDITKALTDRLKLQVTFDHDKRYATQTNLKEGTWDISAGATFSEYRSGYAYFSVPYRFEENSLFVNSSSDKKLNFDNIKEFLGQVRIQNFTLGVIKNFTYADPRINFFVSDDINSDIIYYFENDKEAMEALVRGSIDGFITDRVVGAAVLAKTKNGSSVHEIRLGIKNPIHFMFSKASVPLSLVDKFNKEIKEFTNSKDYKEIVKTYVYPVMMMQTIESDWFYIIGIIGTIAFAISGIAIAAKDNATLFGTFLFAMLPSVGGGIIRDILVNRNELGIFLTPSYMYYILIVVLIGFSAVRLLEFYNQHATEDSIILKFWDNILVIGDTIGQAAFIITGVTIVIMARIEPIELWGPFFAFLTANGGGIIRDLLRKTHKIICLTGAINAEVAVIWGLFFSIYLDMSSFSPDPDGIKIAVMVTVLGAVATRLVAYYFNIPNIKFRADLPPEEVKKENIMP